MIGIWDKTIPIIEEILFLKTIPMIPNTIAQNQKNQANKAGMIINAKAKPNHSRAANRMLIIPKGIL